MRGRLTERERERHLVFHSPNGHTTQGQTTLKAGARNFFWVFHMGAGTQAFGPSAAFPSTLTGTWIRKVEQPGLELAPIWDVGIAGSSLTCYAIVPALCVSWVFVLASFPVESYRPRGRWLSPLAQVGMDAQ